MGEDVSAEAAASPQGAARSTVFLSPANGHQDAFDRDDFDAVAYINEMFPTGASQSPQSTVLSWQPQLFACRCKAYSSSSHK